MGKQRKSAAKKKKEQRKQQHEIGKAAGKVRAAAKPHKA